MADHRNRIKGEPTMKHMWLNKETELKEKN